VIQFEEPGAEYELEEIKTTNIKTRIKVITLFVVFILLVVFLIKNDFRLDLFQTKILKADEGCDPKYEYNWNDEEVTYMEKANSVLSKYHSDFKEMMGFDYAIVESEPVGYQQGERPVIKVYFRGVNETPIRIPDRICGYRVTIIYK